MKMMVKLTVLMATLLLLTGVAFADWCKCYEINWTSLDFPGKSRDKSFHEICFDYDNVGSVYGMCTPCWWADPMYMFFDPYKKEAVIYSDSQFYETCMTYLKFHGDQNHVVQGLLYSPYGSGRWELRGHQVDEENCYCPI